MLTRPTGDLYAHCGLRSLDHVAHDNCFLVVPNSLYEKVTGQRVLRPHNEQGKFSPPWALSDTPEGGLTELCHSN